MAVACIWRKLASLQWYKTYTGSVGPTVHSRRSELPTFHKITPKLSDSKVTPKLLPSCLKCAHFTLKSVATPLRAQLNLDKKSQCWKFSNCCILSVRKAGFAQAWAWWDLKVHFKWEMRFQTYEIKHCRPCLLLSGHKSAQVCQAAWHLYYISGEQFSCLENIENNFDLTLESCFKRLIIHKRKIAQQQLLEKILRKKIDRLFWGKHIIMI